MAGLLVVVAALLLSRAMCLCLQGVLSVESSGRVSASGSTVDVSGSESVRVGSGGAAVELGGASGGAHVCFELVGACVWRVDGCKLRVCGSVFAGGVLDATAGESIRVMSESISVDSLRSIAASTASASLVAETSLALLGSGADISVSSSSASLSSVGSVTAVTGGGSAVSGVHASVVASEILAGGSDAVRAHVASRVSAVSSSAMDSSTEERQ